MSALGSLTPAGSLMRRLRAKFLSAGVIAAAGVEPTASGFSTFCRVFVHFALTTVTGAPSPGPC